MRKINPGSYDAKIVDYGLTETKNNKPMAFVTFGIQDAQDSYVELTWRGLLDPKPSAEGKKAPSEYTVKTLLDCGFKGESIENMAAGKDSNIIDIGHEMTVVVEDNEYDGETYSQIRWVNIKGETHGPSRMTQDQASAKLPTGALRAQLMKARQEKATGTETLKSPI